MTELPSSFRTPYTDSPGSSTPSPEVSPKEGREDLIAFAWLALFNTLLIGVVGVATWYIIQR